MLRSLSSRHSLSLTGIYSKVRANSTLHVSSLGIIPTTQSPVVSNLSFFNSVTGDGSKIPTYRVLDGLGTPVEGAEVPEVCVPFRRPDQLTFKLV